MYFCILEKNLYIVTYKLIHSVVVVYKTIIVDIDSQ